MNTQNDKLIQKLAGAAPYKMKFSPANAFDPKKPEHENSLQVYPKCYILFACSTLLGHEHDAIFFHHMGNLTVNNYSPI